MESFPFFLFLSLIIASFVIAVSFDQIKAFSAFTAQKELIDSYNKITQTIKILKENSDVGSFKKIKIKIPQGYKLDFDVNNDEITIIGEKNITNKLNVNLTDITFDNPLNSGTYELVIYYGELNKNTERPFAIYFK